jgi:hypothetical protein
MFLQIINHINNFSLTVLFNFDRGSSFVNFCETDILSLEYSEMWNTCSSLMISLFGLYGMCKIAYTDELAEIFKKHQDISLKKEYIQESKLNRYILNFVLILVGFGSFYFHSELSEFAHWVDILFISMILILSDKYLDNINLNKKRYIYYLFGVVHLITSILIPSIHIFLQYFTGFYIVTKINKLIKKLETKSQENYDVAQICISVKKKYSNTKNVFYFSLIVWLIDYFLCFLIKPYHLHWIFHIGIGWVAYSIIDLSKYLWLIRFNEVLENKV